MRERKRGGKAAHCCQKSPQELDREVWLRMKRVIQRRECGEDKQRGISRGRVPNTYLVVALESGGGLGG